MSDTLNVYDALRLNKWKNIPAVVKRYFTLNPNDPKHVGRINVLSGFFGSGKTSVFEQLKTDNCITVNPRIDVLKEFIQRTAQIDWTFYQDDEERIRHYLELINAPCLAICNLTLWKLQSTQPLREYEHFIYDETPLGLASMVGKDAKHKKEDYQVLDALMRTSKTVWLCGWLFDDLTIDWIESFGRPIKWHKITYPTLKDLKLEICNSERDLLERIKQEKRGGVFIGTEKSNSAPKIITKYGLDNSNWDYTNSKRRLTAEQVIQFNDIKAKMNYDYFVASPVISAGTNIRNEFRTTALLFNNANKSLSGEDIANLAFRNRDAEKIMVYITQQDLDKKNVKTVEQIAIKSAALTTDDIKNFGEWDRKLSQRTVNTNDWLYRFWEKEIIKKAVGTAFRGQIFVFILEELLELQEKNVKRIADTEKTLQKLTEQEYRQKIITDGKLLNLAEYIVSNHWQSKAYTEIATDLDQEEITLDDFDKWDGGYYKENVLRQKQMHDPYIVRLADIKTTTGINKKQEWNKLQFMVKRFIQDKSMTITNWEWKQSGVWVWLKNNTATVNRVMEYQQLHMLKITENDKAVPIKWLERYLTKHNYNCNLIRPDKTDIAAKRKAAERTNKQAFENWKAEQKAKEKKDRFRQLTNFSITHYLESLLDGLPDEVLDSPSNAHKLIMLNEEITSLHKLGMLNEEMKELRLVMDDYLLEIKEHS